jgi:hypothetical protein
MNIINRTRISEYKELRAPTGEVMEIQISCQILDDGENVVDTSQLSLKFLDLQAILALDEKAKIEAITTFVKDQMKVNIDSWIRRNNIVIENTELTNRDDITKYFGTDMIEIQ